MTNEMEIKALTENMHYTKYIRSHADWEFVGVYTDEGISALSTL